MASSSSAKSSSELIQPFPRSKRHLAFHLRAWKSHRKAQASALSGGQKLARRASKRRVLKAVGKPQPEGPQGAEKAPQPEDKSSEAPQREDEPGRTSPGEEEPDPVSKLLVELTGGNPGTVVLIFELAKQGLSPPWLTMMLMKQFGLKNNALYILHKEFGGKNVEVTADIMGKILRDPDATHKHVRSGQVHPVVKYCVDEMEKEQAMEKRWTEMAQQREQERAALKAAEAAKADESAKAG